MKIMKIIVGLGNPGKKYLDTRHNVGFSFADVLAVKHNIKIKKLQCRALVGVGNISGESVVIAKPQTFMNLSGESVKSLLVKYKCTPADLIVIYDDAALPVGKIRIRKQGSDGGHNGIKSIIYINNTDEFTRIKIGIGAPDGELADYVLDDFSPSEIKLMTELSITVCEAVETILTSGDDVAMNKYN